MKRVELFQNDDIDKLNKHINKWVDNKKPNIISVTTIADDSEYYVVTIFYDDGLSPVTTDKLNL